LFHIRTRIRKNPQREWKGKEKLDDETRHELMRKKLCFTCRESWVPGHRCMGKGQIHYIEVTSDSEEEEEIRPTPDIDSSSSEEEHAHEEGQPPEKPQGPREKTKPRVPGKGGVIDYPFGST
jgi:hypothetical protein